MVKSFFISLKRPKLMSSEKLIVTWLFALFFSCCEMKIFFPRQRPTAEASAIFVAIDPLFDHYRLEDSRTLQDLSYRISMASKNGFCLLK